ncbi:PHP domain-containing protein [Oculatella sp. LEGE 06141]|uniref:PHP domain-containing protein n=1 Tax=Oculatella sp. LEGE 06141 TaxID=1828648 RepID=UPI00187F4D8F|nr:PHP domain-containing protein [Oculatella sp. LEGE 06141]MBE9181455.1 PHP domain-containing protein [Oculatella sp. LEGE 06141]
MTVNLAQASTLVAAQNASALRQVFGAIHAESCPRLFNFHMHTVHSDGKLQPEQLMEQAVSIGLQGLAITDHHSVSGYRRAQQWLTNWLASSAPGDADKAPFLWTGIEINANLLGGEVHILAYAFDPEHDAIQPYLQGRTTTGQAYQASQIITAIRQAGGIAVLAHPARYKRSPAELIPAIVQLGIDGVEAYYAYNNPTPWQPSPRQTEEVLELSEAYGLLNTCGTDTHGLSLLQRL